MKLTHKKDFITLGLLILVFLSWFGLIIIFHFLPKLALVVCGAILVALHGSLQHELIHNHPFKNQKINDFMGHFSPIPWLPYILYKNSHLAHHACEHYSHPDFDPETFYVNKQTYDSFPYWIKKVFDWNQTLFGRIIFGPLISFVWIIKKELYYIGNGNFKNAKLFIPHLIIWSVILWFFARWDISIMSYLFLIAFPGYSLILVRSFLEHKPHNIRDHQTCIVESGNFFSFLFLNNNLHLIHHKNMSAPWYELPRLYRNKKQQWLDMNDDFHYENYRTIFKKYLLRPKSSAWVETSQ